jgi:hypothetical protein
MSGGRPVACIPSPETVGGSTRSISEGRHASSLSLTMNLCQNFPRAGLTRAG